MKNIILLVSAVQLLFVPAYASSAKLARHKNLEVINDKFVLLQMKKNFNDNTNNISWGSKRESQMAQDTNSKIPSLGFKGPQKNHAAMKDERKMM